MLLIDSTGARQGTVEQNVDGPVPQVVEETVVQIILQERISESIIDRIVDVPVETQRQVPTFQTVQKTVENLQVQFLDHVVDVPVVMQQERSLEFCTVTTDWEEFMSGLCGFQLRSRCSMCQVRVESKSEEANDVGGDLASMFAVNAVLETGGSVDAVTALRRRYSSRLNPTTRVLSRGGVSEHSASLSLLTRLRQHCTTPARGAALMAHHLAWVGHHTGGSRSTPTVHPC